jgi:hypothetical protein
MAYCGTAKKEITKIFVFFFAQSTYNPFRNISAYSSGKALCSIAFAAFSIS